MLFFLVISRGCFLFATLSPLLNVLDAPRIQASDTSIYQAVLAPRILGNTALREEFVLRFASKPGSNADLDGYLKISSLTLRLRVGLYTFHFFLNPSAHISYIACSLLSAPTGANSLLFSASGVDFFFSSLAGKKNVREESVNVA